MEKKNNGEKNDFGEKRLVEKKWLVEKKNNGEKNDFGEKRLVEKND